MSNRVISSVVLALASLVAFTCGYLGVRVIHLEAELAIVRDHEDVCARVAKTCDRELVTCLGWQARVHYDLAAVIQVLKDGL